MKFIKVLEGKTFFGKKRKKVVIDLSSIRATSETSAEEQLEDLKVQDELELVFKLILSKIEFDVSVDNNGIGFYQYGSSNENDKGENFLTVEDEDTRVHAVITLGEVSSLAARNFLRDSCLSKRTLFHPVQEDITLEVNFTPVLSYEGRGFLAYKIEIGT